MQPAVCLHAPTLEYYNRVCMEPISKTYVKQHLHGFKGSQARAVRQVTGKALLLERPAYLNR